MERRKFLKSSAAAGVAGAALASTFPKPAISQGITELRMVTSWPRGLPGVGTGAQRLADRISLMSEGRLRVQLYSGGELVPPLQVFDAVSDGTADLGHDASYYHTSKADVAAFFSTFPWGFTYGEMVGWIYHGEGQALWDELYEPFNLKPFLAGNTGTQMLGWFRNEINDLSDIRGLRFRAPGNGGKVWTKLGANVVTLAGGEIFQALQSGTIDGTEWIGPYNDLSLGFYQVAKYYYSPGFHEPATSLQLVANRERYYSLPPSFQEIIRTAAEAGCNDIYAEYTAYSGPSLRALVQEHGVQLRIVPTPILRAMGYAANEILKEVREKDDISRRIVESYLKYRQDAVAWTRVGELQYLNSRQLDFPHGT